MNKVELIRALQAGKNLVDCFEFSSGQECEIYKANQFQVGSEIIYIPDIYLNEIDIDKVGLSEDEIEDILDNCYSGDDFMHECDGNLEQAKMLFAYCDWQHPSSAVGEIDEEDE